MMKRRFLGGFPFVAAGISLLRCGGELSVAARTSGHIGCAERDIVISDDAGATWTASCNGKTFYCSSHPIGKDGEQIACTEAEVEKPSSVENTSGSANATPTGQPTAGCQYDTQCKGDRVCVGGSCVSPASTDDSATD